MKTFKYLYGPVHSWRLGYSLGVDPLSQKQKVCNYDCIYCQLGKTKLWINERQMFIPTAKIVDEISQMDDELFDHITFSGRGEPTLASNLGEMIRAIKKIRLEKIAVITNSSLLTRQDVQEDLLNADVVLAKIDAFDELTFEYIAKPMEGIDFFKILDGLRRFRKVFKGKLALQIMLMSANKVWTRRIAQEVFRIHADEIELNTPTRRCRMAPLTEIEINPLKKYFEGMNVVSCFDKPVQNVYYNNDRLTKIRHGVARALSTEQKKDIP